jgi:hypothetical protein
MQRRVQVDSLTETRRRFEQWRKFRGSGEPRVLHARYVLACGLKHLGEPGRHILIEQEFQVVSSVCRGYDSSSRANQAA